MSFKFATESGDHHAAQRYENCSLIPSIFTAQSQGGVVKVPAIL
jgi:hypothetical protein